MNKSETTSELFKALSVFQGELENVDKGKSGHGYKYADLGSCIDAAKPFLAKNGLSVIQLLGSSPTGETCMETVLGHSSGEYISSSCVLPIAKLAGGGANNPAQVMGASITYMRRYQYAAIIGLAQEDTDGVPTNSNQAQTQSNQEPNWYNSFETDKEAMIQALSNGTTNEGIISALRAQGYAINKKITQQIMELTA